MTSDTRKMVPPVEEVAQALASMGIKAQQFHAESTPGQFEFISSACYATCHRRHPIRSPTGHRTVAERWGLRALHPRPFPTVLAMLHMPISLWVRGQTRTHPSPACYVALSLSQDASYERVRSGVWSGSEWVAWGFQNRKAPVRKTEAGHWEIKSVHDIANMYLAVAGLLAGGYLGVKQDMSYHEGLHW